MSKILKVDQGDYVIQVQPGGNIILDAGSTGKVIFTGGIDISGTNTTINSTNTEIADNIFTLNNGEIGPGISVANNYEAGISIDRGTISSNAASAQIIFSETEDAYNPLTGTRIAGAFLLRTTSGSTKTLTNLKITTAELRAISSTGAYSIDVNLSSGNGVVNLVNSTYTTGNLEYHERVTDSSLVNKKYVTTYVAAGGITSGMADVDKLYKRKVDNSIASKVLATTTALEFSISSSNIATIKSDGLSVNNINPYTGNVVTVNSVLGLSNQSSDPSVVADKTVIYSKPSAGAGSSGIFFKNDIASDELVAKNRALLLSMLF